MSSVREAVFFGVNHVEFLDSAAEAFRSIPRAHAARNPTSMAEKSLGYAP